MKPAVLACSSLLLMSGSFALAAPALASIPPVGTTFSTPGQYTCVVPDGVTSATWSVRGGDGGSGSGGTAAGGFGALVSGTTLVSPGDVLYVTVGGNGESGSDGSSLGFPLAGGGGGYSSVATGSYAGTPLGVAGGGGGGAGTSGRPGGNAGYDWAGASFAGGGNGGGIGTDGGLTGIGGTGSWGITMQTGGNGGSSGAPGGDGVYEPSTPIFSGGGGGGGGFGGAGGLGDVGDPGVRPGAAGGFAGGGSSGWKSGGGGGGFGGGGGGSYTGGGGGGSSLKPVGGSAISDPGGYPMAAFDFYCVGMETSNEQGPAPILQQLPPNAEGSCNALPDSAVSYGTGLRGGWRLAWAQWANSGKGGPVCGRTMVYSAALSRWTIAV